jgi:hypothetical protein
MLAMQKVSHQATAGSVSAVHMRACTGLKNAHNSVTVKNRTYIENANSTKRKPELTVD